MPVNPDGTLRPYNSDEIAAFKLRTRGIRDGSHPTERFSQDGSGCERPWFCDYGQRFDVIKHLVGEVLKWDDGGTAKLSRLWPQSHPTFTQWICTQARITGHKFVEDSTTGGAGNKMPRWETAEIMATYEQVPFRFVPDDELESEIQRYVTNPGHVGAEVTSTAQYIGMPGGILKFKTPDGSPPHNVSVPYPVGYTECEGRFSAIWRRIPELMFRPESALYKRVYGDPDTGSRPWVGSTNLTVLFGRDIGTCLLEGCEPRLLPDPIGSGYSWDLKWMWFYKPQTHYKLRFWDTAGSIANGYYTVAKPDAPWLAIDTFADDDSLFPLRDHTDGLFKVN